jgi:hypothetical protein
VVEGIAAAFQQNELQDAVDTSQHIRRGHPKRPNTRVGEPLIAVSISIREVAEFVNSAINLNAQPGPLRIEIKHVRPSRVLFAELESARPLSKMLPKDNFRQSHLSSKRPCAFNVSARASEHSPPPRFAWSPSPKGEDYYPTSVSMKA